MVNAAVKVGNGWETGVTTLCRKAFTWTHVFYSSNVEHLKILCRSDATVDDLGMCLYASLWIRLDALCVSMSSSKGYYIHIGVGFEVACLNRVASSKARDVR